MSDCIPKCMFSAKSVEKDGIKPWTLERMEKSGELLRFSHGIYLHKDLCPDSSSFAAEATIRFPQSVICLRSAAELNNMTNESRDSYFLAIPKENSRTKVSLGNKIDGIKSVNWLRWDSKKLEIGIYTKVIHGITIHLTSPARTVVDYFKYGQGTGKNEFFGRDEVLEVFNNYVSDQKDNKRSLDDLIKISRIFKVDHHITPLIEGQMTILGMRF